jgi:hypothetical protein
MIRMTNRHDEVRRRKAGRMRVAGEAPVPREAVCVVCKYITFSFVVHSDWFVSNKSPRLYLFIFTFTFYLL